MKNKNKCEKSKVDICLEYLKWTMEREIRYEISEEKRKK